MHFALKRVPVVLLPVMLAGAAATCTSPRSSLDEPPPSAHSTGGMARAAVGLPGWRVSGGNPDGYLIRRDTSMARSGRGSAYLRSRAPHANDAYASLVQTMRAERYRGQRVRLSGYLRLRDLARGGSVWLRVDGAGRVLAFDDMGGGGLDGADRHPKGTTSGWQPVAVVLDVHPDAEGLAMGVTIAGGGELWADDLALEIVGPEVAVTAAPEAFEPLPDSVVTQRLAQQRARYAMRSISPVNLDFEAMTETLRP